MKKTWIIIIIITIVLGITIFIFYQNREITISVPTYDRSSIFVLGKYKVIEYSTTKSGSPMTSFKFKNEEDEKAFLDDLINMEEYIGLYQYEKFEYHYLFSNDEYFIVRKDRLGFYVIRPVFAIFYRQEKWVNIRFHFPVDYHFDDSESKEIILNITYDEFIEYYERYSSDEIFIDYENKTVYSAACNNYISDEVKGKPVKIIWTENSLLIEYVGDEDK